MLGLLLLLELERLLLLLLERGGLTTGWVRGKVRWEELGLLLRVGRHRMWLASCTSSAASAPLSTTTTASIISPPLASLAASGLSASTSTTLASSATLLPTAPSVPSSWLLAVTVEIRLIFATFFIVVRLLLSLLSVCRPSGRSSRLA